jgi:hypothetical protein
MAIGALNHAYSNYQSAGRAVTDGLKHEKDLREEREKQFVNIAIGAAGLLLSPVGSAIGAAVAGPALQKGLVSKLEEVVPKILAKEGTDMQTRQALTDALVSKIANDRVTALLAKLTPEAATGLVGKAAGAAAGVMAKVDVRGSVEDKASSYVEALENSADKSSSSLLTALGLCTDPGALIGVHGQFSSATAKLYQSQIDTAAHHFMTQVGSVIGPEGKSQIVSLNAYGKERLANVRYLSDSANYVFHSWVTPDMEPLVRSINPNPHQITPEMISGHIPEPTKEGASYGQEQILKVNAWGKMRLVVVKADQGSFKTNYGEMHFVRWVSADTEAEAQGKGGTQIGGISQIDPSLIKGLQKPAD